MLIWLAMQAATPAEEPIANLRGVVVDAIRNCLSANGEITVCSRDRGFAEGQRLPKIKKPEPPPGSPGVTVTVTSGQVDNGTTPRP